MDTQTQVERLIELAIVQRTELRQLVEQLPQLRDHLNAEIERTFEEVEPQIRVELEEFCRARATDEHAKTGAALGAKIDELSKKLEATTSAKYSVLLAERAHNVELERIATEQVAQAANQIPEQVKAIVADELSRFPRAGEIDQLRKEFATPAGLNPRGKWQAGQTYQRLDVVSYNGNSYIANATTSEKPSVTSSAWTVNAARGVGGGGPSSLNELTQTPTNGSVLIGSGTAWVTSTLTAGTGISIANAAGSITINATDGDIALDDGTAALPSLNFTNDPDTGIYRIGANNLGVSVGGVNVLDINGSAATFAGPITVNSTTGSVFNAATGQVEVVLNKNGVMGLQLIASTTDSYLSAGTSMGLYFRINGNNDALRLQSSGATFLNPVTVSSATAGSASAGAIVATGGISAKNLFITAAVATYDNTNPSIAFTSGGGALGFYAQSNTVYFASTAQRIMGFTNTGLSFSINGDVTSPNIATDSAGTSGFFAPSNGSIAYSGGGTERFRIAATTGLATFAFAVATSSTTLSGAGAIPITTSLVKYTSTGVSQALSLANGVDGQRLTIVHDVDGGSGVLTPTTKTGFSTVTFTNAGDTVTLVYVTTRGWMVTGSYLATIAP